MVLLRWVSLLLSVSQLIIIPASTSQFIPADNYLISCGSSRPIKFQGRSFLPDSNHPSLLLESQDSAVVYSTHGAPSPIYKSARIFKSRASYEFQIKNEGHHWVRLYFFPFPNADYDLIISSSLTVVTEEFVLLNKFTFKNYHASYLFKEYAVNVTSGAFTLTFLPSRGSVAFVNAIEVVSMPEKLLQLPELSHSSALEIIYRLNVGGPLISPLNDTQGRTWESNLEYSSQSKSSVNVSVDREEVHYPDSVTDDIAPAWVYATAQAQLNSSLEHLTWVFPVDPNFEYFIRVHLCDVISEYLDDMVLDIFINDVIAFGSLDLSSATGGLRVPYYKDFISNSSATLTVSVGASRGLDSKKAVLNGLEIMKVSNGVGSLDGLSSVTSLKKHQSFGGSKIMISCIASVSVTVAVAGVCFCCMVSRRSKTAPGSEEITGNVFTLEEIKEATEDFDENLILGFGGFGTVYQGKLRDGTKVAVKRATPNARQGQPEFKNEIELLSELRHPNIVSLLGYCNEGTELILIYEFMANGTLSRHICGGADLEPLPWKQRLEICTGAAKGLHYLHTGRSRPVIHRDVKASNILLDENFVAKVSDFGISRKGPDPDHSHVTTAIKGSFGYLDPEYFRSKHLTEKSDVYSFGVILLEILSARPALDHSLPTEQMSLSMWASNCQTKGMVDLIIDPYLKDTADQSSLMLVWDTAKNCLAERRSKRPTMEQVLSVLERALQLERVSSDEIQILP